MIKYVLPTTISLALCASLALAHSGVQNPKVMERMMLMTDIAGEMKKLGAIAKGDQPFDATQTAISGAALAEHARDMVTLFEANETDPKSEALPVIWTDFSGFAAKAEEMEQAATLVSSSSDLTGFNAAFRALGQSCTACHKTYRK